MSARLISTFVCAVALLATPAAAITLGQIDTFQDGGTADWRRGSLSTNQPANMASGGPGGAEDNYLHQISTGTGRADSRMVMFNTAQWAGDYEGAGVGAIRMMVNNLGDNTLHLRIAIEGGAGNSRYTSTEPAIITPGSGWIQIVFGLGNGDLDVATGADSREQVLADVSELRLLSSTGGLTWIGDQVAGILGVDDIEAIAVAVPTEAAGVSSLKSAWR